jgi:hypothetical protein
MSKKETYQRGLDGYTGQPPVTVFTLAPHHRALKIKGNSPLTAAAEARQDNGLRLLRDPNGRPVCRTHADLQPGEVSLVLR